MEMKLTAQGSVRQAWLSLGESVSILITPSKGLRTENKWRIEQKLSVAMTDDCQFVYAAVGEGHFYCTHSKVRSAPPSPPSSAARSHHPCENLKRSDRLPQETPQPFSLSDAEQVKRRLLYSDPATGAPHYLRIERETEGQRQRNRSQRRTHLHSNQPEIIRVSGGKPRGWTFALSGW
ncbi:hypothetical protein AOLI_G00211440 [Acnodon oligacanthus]